tara:strand:+ start:405 stop:527 length:123 start_codon:yes stop_codon:yes gene_type:complete
MVRAFATIARRQPRLAIGIGGLAGILLTQLLTILVVQLPL